jgi:hypothetical protein
MDTSFALTSIAIGALTYPVFVGYPSVVTIPASGHLAALP